MIQQYPSVQVAPLASALSCIPEYICQDIKDLKIDDEFHEWSQKKEQSKLITNTSVKKSQTDFHNIIANLQQKV